MTAQSASPEPVEPAADSLLDPNLHLYIDAALDAQDHEPMPDLDLTEFLGRVADDRTMNHSDALGATSVTGPEAVPAEDEPSEFSTPQAYARRDTPAEQATCVASRPQGSRECRSTKDLIPADTASRRCDTYERLLIALSGTLILSSTIGVAVANATYAGLSEVTPLVSAIATHAISVALGAVSIVVAWRAHNGEDGSSTTARSMPRRGVPLKYLTKRWIRRRGGNYVAPDAGTRRTHWLTYDPQLIYHQVKAEFSLPAEPVTEQPDTQYMDRVRQLSGLPSNVTDSEDEVVSFDLADEVSEYLHKMWLDHAIGKGHDAIRRLAENAPVERGSLTTDGGLALYEAEGGHDNGRLSNVPELVRHNLENLVLAYFAVSQGVEISAGSHFALVNSNCASLRYHSDARFNSNASASPILLWTDGDGGWAVARETSLGKPSAVTHLTDPRLDSTTFESALRAVVELSSGKVIRSSEEGSVPA